MPGTLVTDALALDLFSGATLNAAGTTNGTVRQIDKPGLVQAMINTGTVTSTGNSATLNVELRAADDLAFTVNVVSLGRFGPISGTDATQSNKEYSNFMIRCDKNFVRATVILGGTAPVYTASTCKLVMENLRRTAATVSAGT